MLCARSTLEFWIARTFLDKEMYQRYKGVDQECFILENKACCSSVLRSTAALAAPPPLGPRAAAVACRRSRLSREPSLQLCTCSGATHERRLLAPYPARFTIGAATAGWLLDKHQKCSVSLLEGRQKFPGRPPQLYRTGFSPTHSGVFPTAEARSAGAGPAPLCPRPGARRSCTGRGGSSTGAGWSCPGARCGRGAARRKASHGKRQGGRAGPASEQKVRRGSWRERGWPCRCRTAARGRGRTELRRGRERAVGSVGWGSRMCPSGMLRSRGGCSFLSLRSSRQNVVTQRERTCSFPFGCGCLSRADRGRIFLLSPCSAPSRLLGCGPGRHAARPGGSSHQHGGSLQRISKTVRSSEVWGGKETKTKF